MTSPFADEGPSAPKKIRGGPDGEDAKISRLTECCIAYAAIQVCITDYLPYEYILTVSTFTQVHFAISSQQSWRASYNGFNLKKYHWNIVDILSRDEGQKVIDRLNK